MSAKIGKSQRHVSDCLRLLRLPKKAMASLEDQKIGVTIGYLIAKLPTMELRDRLTKEVLAGYGDGRPLSTREVEDLIAKNYIVELRGAPFDQADASLEIVGREGGDRVSGGACGDCPWNSANSPEVESKFPICMNPWCYQDKVKAHTAKIKQRALDSGALVVEGDKAAKLLYHDGTPSYDSGLVRLDAKPDAGEIAGGKKAPTWKKMLAGLTTVDVVVDHAKTGEAIKGTATAAVKVQPIVVIDAKGVAHELVERKVAIEAAKKNGYDGIFSAHATRAKNSMDATRLKENADEKRKKKIQKAESHLALSELSKLVVDKGIPNEAWYALLDASLQHCCGDGQALVITRREIPLKKVNGMPDKNKTLRDYAQKLNHGNEMAAFIMELLLAGIVRWQGIRSVCFKPVAKVYELPLDGIEQKVKFDFAALEKKKEKPAKAPAEEPAQAPSNEGKSKKAGMPKTCGF